MPTIHRTVLLTVAVLSSMTGPHAASRTAQLERIAAAHSQLQQQFAAALEPLAAEYAALGQSDAATRLRQWQLPFAQLTLDVDLLPETVAVPLPEDLAPAERARRESLRSVRHAYADDLFLLAQRAIRDGLPSYAFQLLRETALHDPDQEVARRALGYVRHGDRWTTPFTALMLRKGQVRHPQFGWLPEAHVPRYEAGERFYRGQWMPAAKESLLRAAMANGWETESDHFVVRTNDSLEKAVELSGALEDLHRYFVREFSDLFNTPQQMQQLFGSGKPRAPSGVGKHEVWYFRSADEFERFIANKQLALRGVNGIYLPAERCAYFYSNPADPQRNVETMYHEVTHQILSESALKTFAIAEQRDFWIVEGFACYMESFDRSGLRPRIGDPRHPRIYWARERVVTENWYVPTAQFTAFGMREFQLEVDFPTLQKYYSQATGLTHFLLHYAHGRYRDGCIEYLGQLYSPDKSIRLRPRTIAEILGVPFETLDAEYREYVSSLPTSSAR